MSCLAHTACKLKIRNASSNLVGKPDGKRPPERDRLQDNIKISCKETMVGKWVVDITGSALGPMVSSLTLS
jgi:hypothetical protein